MLTGIGREDSFSFSSSSANLVTPCRRRAASVAAATLVIRDVLLPAGCNYSSAKKVTQVADDLNVVAGMLQRRAENIHAGVAVASLSPSPSLQQSCSCENR